MVKPQVFPRGGPWGKKGGGVKKKEKRSGETTAEMKRGVKCLPFTEEQSEG